MTQTNIFNGLNGRRNRRIALLTAIVLALLALGGYLAVRNNWNGAGDFWARMTNSRPATSAAIQAPAVTKDTDMTAETNNGLTVIMIDNVPYTPATDLTLESGVTYLVRKDAGGNRYVVLDNQLHKLIKAMAIAPTAAPVASTTNPTNPTITLSTDIQNKPPFLFDAQSCDPEQSGDGGCSWDIGTKGDDNVAGTAQFTLIFGVDISWPAGGAAFAADPNNACEIVALDKNTWFENVNLKDARDEVNDVSLADYAGWRNSLVALRIVEQSAHYGCPAWRNSIPFWTMVNGVPTVQQLDVTPLQGMNVDTSTSNSANLNGAQNGQAVDFNTCKTNYANRITEMNNGGIADVNAALNRLKAKGVSYDTIDPVRLVKDGSGKVTGVSIASATNLHIPYPFGLGTDAPESALHMGSTFTKYDLGSGNILLTDVTLKGGFGGTIWFGVDNYEQFCNQAAGMTNVP